MLSCVVSCDTTKNPQNTTLPNTHEVGSRWQRCAGWVVLRDILKAVWQSRFSHTLYYHKLIEGLI